ncbi:MBL fold metallo-hydrolase [Roseateles saccharophilus]|uniref:Glyoxylase-like metal-dependent hydrolase (Beta-lactamase superfamily II) n=1 Tax=Roseateles saccharophilus TaxID=304 RepID=A0A4R3V564_ROSSA|nr:MBL fold metallo-hydrolase [Roseateles saccharophilus]MDG0831863.1 MBL fold metallo-hydrolase [Roseateles saccharophilus]TCU97474.1 glyoxylase-like metal-dependent hydrolase (beta-lactamase superfamily II) [Roseateles saccharophilus]
MPAWKLWFALLACLGPGPASADVVADAAQITTKGYALRDLGGGAWWICDGAYNTLFVVSETGVIAIDPLPTLGANYLKAIAEVTPLPVTHIVYSHAHLDHIGAAGLFPRTARIVAQQQVGEALDRAADPRRPPPTQRFERHLSLDVGGQRLELDYRGINHAAGNLFIHLPRQRVLMLVDVVYPGYAPYPGLGIAADVQGYLEAHEQALAYDFDTLVAGHVDRLGTREDVLASQRFARELLATARRNAAAQPFPAFLKTRPPGSTWLLHDDYEATQVQACVDALLPRWRERLVGLERSISSHCCAAVVALAVAPPKE